MKCSKCGAELKVGSMYCYQCGNEAQLVPDYNVYEEDFFESVKAEEEKKIEEKKQREKTEREADEQKKRDKKRLTIMIVILVAAVAVIAGIVTTLVRHNNSNSYDYQMKQAYNAYDHREYMECISYANRAQKLKNDSILPMYLIGKSYDALGQPEDAIEILEQAVAMEGATQQEAYTQSLELLLKLLAKQNCYDKISELYEEAKASGASTSAFSPYIISGVTFSSEGGEYDDFLEVELSCAERTAVIYYTLDGTTPNEQSERYEKPIELKEQGTITVRAIAITPKGVSSVVTEAAYTIKLKAPELPQIYPASGTYEEAEPITVNVPEGMRAYYAWDSDVVTTASKKYTGPIEMREGNHVLSVILVNENDMASGIEKRNYIYYPRTEEIMPLD